MTNAASLTYAPLLEPAVIAILAGVALAAALFALVRGMKGWLWRALAAALLAAALANPALVREQREALSDIALLITDDSPSMATGERTEAVQRTAQALRAAAEADPLLELIELSGGEPRRTARA